MHRYEELEKLYYKKKFKKIFLFFLFVFISLLAVFSILKLISFNNIKDIKNKAESNITKNIKSNITKRINEVNITKKNLSKQKHKNEHKKPKNNKTEVKSQINEKNDTAFNLTFILPQIKENKEKKPASKKPVLKVKEKNKTTKNVQPLIKEKKADLKSLKDSFYKFPNYSTAMTIANIYFSKKDLANAKIWALKANNIDPSKYESWKMFAMILLEKNDKIKAKEVLKIYLDNYGENEEISKLLRSINE